jgi:16S rRNA (guanine527-N7)-methyltransferase
MNPSDLRHTKEADTFFHQAEQLGVPVNETQFDAFVHFFHLLSEKNKVMNLTRITDWEGFLTRHILESLLYSLFIPEEAKVLDVGSGGGFPLIPLAIYRTDLKLTSIEVVKKKALYLAETAEALGVAPIKILSERAEDLGHKSHLRANFDVVTSRAVASLPVLVEYCLPFVKREGVMLALKGPKWEEEIVQAENAIEVLGGEFVDVFIPEGVPALDATCYMVQLMKVANTPRHYPRQAGTPAKNPL